MARVLTTIINVAKDGFVTKSYKVEGRPNEEIVGAYWHKCFDCFKEFIADKWDRECPYCASRRKRK